MVEGGVTVNWIRMVLDGFMMAAYFNLFAAAVAIFKPRLMFPCYRRNLPQKRRIGSICFGSVSEKSCP